MNICPKCGLPEAACVCKEITKKEQKITITAEKKKYGKIATVICGFDKNIDIKEIAKTLKSKLACGGTIREDGSIELQGDHVKKTKEILIGLGFQNLN